MRGSIPCMFEGLNDMVVRLLQLRKEHHVLSPLLRSSAGRFSQYLRPV